MTEQEAYKQGQESMRKRCAEFARTHSMASLSTVGNVIIKMKGSSLNSELLADAINNLQPEDLKND